MAKGTCSRTIVRVRVATARFSAPSRRPELSERVVVMYHLLLMEFSFL